MVFIQIYILQIFDRLASSIGQDVLDSFYFVLSANHYEKKDILPLIFYSAIAAGYVCIFFDRKSLIILLHIDECSHFCALFSAISYIFAH